MYPNINAGMGAVMATALTVTRASTARFYIIIKPGGANENEIKAMYGTGYADGTPGVFTSIATACATLLAAGRANAGDTLIVAPGHTETISSATALSISVAGLYIRGVGYGSGRPTITLDTATTATINVIANNVSIDNVIFVANFAGIASLFTLTTATDFRLTACEFRDTSAILNFVNIVDTNTTSNNADGLLISGCKRIGLGADSNTTIVKMDGTNDRLTMSNNYFSHAAVTAAGLMIIATGKVVTNADINTNVCLFVGATGLTTGLLITTNGSTNSGVIRSNMITGLDATTPILVTASSGFKFFANTYVHTADTSGYLLPAADS